MQSTSTTPCNTCYYYIPKHLSSLHFVRPSWSSPFLKLAHSENLVHRATHFKNKYKFVTLSSTHSCQQEEEEEKHIHLQELYSKVEKEKPHQRKDKEETKGTRIVVASHSGILSSRWWTGLKAALGQRINLEGIVLFFGMFFKEKHLAIPHVFVPDIRYIDWGELKRRGFQGVVFDKDNTITAPYSLNLWSPLASSIDQCKSLFGDNIAVFSNSAGLYEYDPDGRNARILERAIGIKVIRHRVKKPAGTAEEIEKQFGCKSSRLIMVGDRPFTDIVYGNRNGFFTILTKPLSVSKEPLIVQQVRILEMALVNRWSRKGIRPINHLLLPDCKQSVTEKPL